MEAHTRFDITHAFVATSDDIKKFWSIFTSYGLVVTVAASCTDGLVRHFDSCESLLQYDNPTRAAITSLDISARLREPYTTAEISLGARYSAPISISLRGDEGAVSSMRTYVSDASDGMRAWYSAISRIDFFYIWFPVLVFLLMLGQVMSPSGVPHPATPLKKAVESLAFVGLVIGGIAAAIWSISLLRKRCFPVATFAIGQGLSRHKQKEQVRWVVVVGFVVGVGASLVATVLLA